MSLGTLSIDIEARLARLEQGLDQAARANKRAADDVAARWSAAGTAIGTAFGALASVAVVQQFGSMVKATVDGVDALNDFADATGTSVENASALEDIARRTGASLETVEGVLVKFNSVLKEAKPGNGADAALKAIGVSAEELRRLDPAEALKVAADALAGFADNGQKARLVQELFGKSVREAAPFLKDLADAGALNATVTTEQAAQAERFNKALAALAKNTEDAKRGILGDLVPAINEMVTRYKAAREVFGFGPVAIFDQKLLPENALTAFQQYRKEVEDTQAAVARYEAQSKAQGGFLNFFDRQGLERAKAANEEAKKYLDFYTKVLGLQNNAGGGRGSVVPGAGDKPSLPDLPEPKKPEQLSEVQKYIDKLMEATTSTAELSEAEKLRFEFLGKLSGATAQERELLESLADGLDKLKAKTKLMGPSDDELFAGAEGLRKQIEGLVSDTDTARIGQIAQQIETLKKALNDPAYAALQPAIIEKLAALGEEAKKMSGVLQETEDALKVFADQAARNIQSALGDTLYDTFKGSTDKILDRWIDLLIRMVAEAKAAEIAKGLLGSDNAFGNWLGRALGIGSGAGGGGGAGAGADVPAGVVSTKAVGVGASKASTQLSVQVVNNAGAAVSTQMSDDGTSLRVVIDQAVSEVERRIVSGGSTRKAIQSAFGVKPALARRG